MVCPAVAMRRTSSGCAAARLPSRKNVARTSCCARMSSSRGVHVAFGPSSKVSASSPGRAGAVIAAPKMREPGHSEAYAYAPTARPAPATAPRPSYIPAAEGEIILLSVCCREADAGKPKSSRHPREVVLQRCRIPNFCKRGSGDPHYSRSGDRRYAVLMGEFSLPLGSACTAAAAMRRRARCSLESRSCRHVVIEVTAKFHTAVNSNPVSAASHQGTPR